MVAYRRLKIPNACYFFTVTLKDRSTDLLVKNISELKAAFKKVQAEMSFKNEAIVILPEHLHCLWVLPEGETNYSERWRRIKGNFTHALLQKGYSFKQAKDKTYSLWQRRYWEHVIRDEVDFGRHFDYIHYNPVKHNLVKNPKDWPYSSFHKYVKEETLSIDWGADVVSNGSYGER